MKKPNIKVKLVGTGCTWTKELSTSYVLDDKLILDAPESNFKSLLINNNLDEVTAICITHFHSDHFCCIIEIVTYLASLGKKITILAPPTCKEKLCALLCAVEEPHLLSYVDSNITFITAKQDKEVELNGFKITPFKVEHKLEYAFGYVFKKGNISIGFTGDTAYCLNVERIIQNSNTVFIDSSAVKHNDKHLTIFEVFELSNKYPHAKFYPIHYSNASKKLIHKKFKRLKDNTTLYITK